MLYAKGKDHRLDYLLILSVVVIVISVALYFHHESIDAHNAKIQFYGIVVDQNNRPVENAVILANISYWTLIAIPMLPPANKTIKLKSDKEGRFKITDRGLSLRLNNIIKDGYKFPHTGFINYGTAYKSYSKPYVIKSFKITKPAEKLVKWEGRYRLEPDGRRYTIDILSGSNKEGYLTGGMQVQFFQDPEGTRSEPSDWSVKLTVANGGLIETTDALMYEAPSTGYKNIWTMQQNRKNKFYELVTNRKFYIKANNGEYYGSFELMFWPYYSDSNKQPMLEMKLLLNPNASRNLFRSKMGR